MDKKKKNLLVFGYGLGVILTFMAVRLMMHHGKGIVPGILLVLAAGFIAVTAMKYQLLVPFYEKWMICAHFIGTIVSTISLSILFYFVFGVIGVFLRILNKDLLDENLNAECKTYFKKREDVPFDQKHYQRQF